MKVPVTTVLLLFSLFGLLITSCRTEEMELIEAPQEQVLKARSAIAGLMQRTTMNDGSNDNIIDNSNCLSILLPATVNINGQEIIVDSEEDFDTIEAIFDEFDEDTDKLGIIFPITIIFNDHSETSINNPDELKDFSDDCNEENEDDDDIECIDFQYPITASVFNTKNEIIDNLTIANDKQLFNFVNGIDEDDVVNVGFPVTVILADGLEMEINDLNELESIIENAINDCDEDDDNDFDDDDCDNCTTNQFADILVGCDDWMVDKLERNDSDLEDQYVGYLFNFASDGTLTAKSISSSFAGTWESNGTGNNITVTISIPNLPDFNDNRNLHEIQQGTGETKVDFRLGDDRLRFESNCNGNGGVDDANLVQALTNGDWYITYFFDDTDETSDFAGYVFKFATNGSATAMNSSGVTNGSWLTSSGDETDLELNLNFGITMPLDEIAEDWDVLEVTADIIRLKDVSGGDGSVDFLTFERSSTGNGGTDLLTFEKN